MREHGLEMSENKGSRSIFGAQEGNYIRRVKAIVNEKIYRSQSFLKFCEGGQTMETELG